MQIALLAAAARLSDRELLDRVTLLAVRERQATVELIAHLAELDRRKLYRGEGYRSLFTYCTEALHLAEHATYKRIVAARACRRFPSLLKRLADGSLNLSTLRLLAPHLTRENVTAVVGEAAGRRKRYVESLVARLAPQPDVPPSVRRLPIRPIQTVPSPPSPIGTGAEAPISPAQEALVLPAPQPQVPPVMALSPGRYRVEFTVSDETQHKLRQVQALLRREIPDGDLATLFDRALTLLLDETARKKLAATDGPRQGQGIRDPRSRHKPAELVRAVWRRDGGRCAFVAKNGRRCGAESFLEFHHVEARALGGQMCEENISLRCRAHNQYEAELLFGPHVPKARERAPEQIASNRAVSPAGPKQLRRTSPGASSVGSRVPANIHQGLQPDGQRPSASLGGADNRHTRPPASAQKAALPSSSSATLAHAVPRLASATARKPRTPDVETPPGCDA